MTTPNSSRIRKVEWLIREYEAELKHETRIDLRATYQVKLDELRLERQELIQDDFQQAIRDNGGVYIEPKKMVRVFYGSRTQTG